MTLEERLTTIREEAARRQPPETQAIMHRSIEDLRTSGILSRVAKVGDRAPGFSLPNAFGQTVSLDALRARGPVVLSFYRGRW
jgi:hypothetical protein